MRDPASDINLLLGILALQMDFINQDQLVRGMNGWILEKRKSLAELLMEQGALDQETRHLLETMVRKHLALHGNDPGRSLGALRSGESLPAPLCQINDGSVQASLAQVSGPAAPNLEPTRSYIPATGMRFQVLRPHASGGLGDVFVARDEELKREVALKEIQRRHADNPESRSRFLLEAEVTGGLEHPGIVPVYGLGHTAMAGPFMPCDLFAATT